MKVLSTDAKEWFRRLLETEIEVERETVNNERIWKDGAPDAATAAAHQMNVDQHLEYIQFLEQLKAQYCA